MAKQHINSINNNKLLDNSIIIFDRGYPSYNMFNFLEEKGLFFLIRGSPSYKVAQTTNSNDSILNYKLGINSKEVGDIKVGPPDGTIKILLTNVFDKTITIILFKELYFLR